MITYQSVLKQAAFVLLGAISSGAWAQSAGTVTHLSGTLSVQRQDGSVRILSQKSEVNRGDLLTTQRDSYAQINMTDGSSMTMRPDTQIRIEQYNFVQDRPQEDNSFLRLVKGGLRTVTGLVGKRGNQDAYKIGTNTATIGIRGSSGETRSDTHERPTDSETPLLDDLKKLRDLELRVDAHMTFTGTYIMFGQDGQELIIPEGSIGRVTLDGRLEITQDPILKQRFAEPIPVAMTGLPGKSTVTTECTVK
jgi:hypothetical protein